MTVEHFTVTVHATGRRNSNGRFVVCEQVFRCAEDVPGGVASILELMAHLLVAHSDITPLNVAGHRGPCGH